MAGAVALALLTSALLLGGKFRLASLGAEAVIYLVVLLAFVAMPGARQLWARIPANAAAVVVFLVVFGQLVGSSRETFPFTRYAMYSDARSTVGASGFWLELPGEQELIHYEGRDAWPALNHGRFGSLQGRALNDPVGTEALLESVARRAAVQLDTSVCAVEFRAVRTEASAVSGDETLELELVSRIERGGDGCSS